LERILYITRNEIILEESSLSKRTCGYIKKLASLLFTITSGYQLKDKHNLNSRKGSRNLSDKINVKMSKELAVKGLFPEGFVIPEPEPKPEAIYEVYEKCAPFDMLTIDGETYSYGGVSISAKKSKFHTS